MLRHKLFAIIALSIFLFADTFESVSQRPNETLPIIEMSQRCLLGGVQNKNWVKTDSFGKKIEGVKKFNLYTFEGAGGEVTTSKIEKGDDNEPCSDFWFAETKSEVKQGIAITSARWNVVPRTPKTIGTKDEIYQAYQKIVGDMLKSKGINKPVVKITQAYRVDLEGDGTDEVIIAANSEGMGEDPRAKAGDYSMLFVRKVAKDKAQTIMIAEEYHTKAAEGLTPSDNNISAIADLNGDGVMEIVIYTNYYEGSSSIVYEIKGDNAVSVLDCGCGA